jgi:hypothetical protein
MRDFDVTQPSFLARRSRPELFGRSERAPRERLLAAKAPLPPGYFAGLDVGQAGEFTALAVVERTEVPGCDGNGRRRFCHAVRHLRRFAGGTPYSEIVGEVAGMFAREPLKGEMLVVDVTAVGEPVMNLLYGAKMDAGIVAVSITAGQYAGADDRGGWLVPRMELASTMQVLLQARRLKVAEELPDAPLLVQELTNFKMRGPLLAADDVLAWREGEHDDLVLAVGIAVWQAERYFGGVAEWVC